MAPAADAGPTTKKARAVEASLAPGAVVSVVARQHGATPQQLFTWRREARRRAQEGVLAEGFVPVVIEMRRRRMASLSKQVSPLAAAWPHSIELDVAGTSIFIWRGAEAGNGERDHRRAEGGQVIGPDRRLARHGGGD